MLQIILAQPHYIAITELIANFRSVISRPGKVAKPELNPISFCNFRITDVLTNNATVIAQEKAWCAGAGFILERLIVYRERRHLQQEHMSM
jgi:hypothetical protein